MSYVISTDQHAVFSTKAAIEWLAYNLTVHLKEWGKTPLPNITGNTLAEFASNPKAYFEKALIEQAKEKGLKGVVPGEYAKLYGIVFTPDLQRRPIDTRYLEFVKVTTGNKVVPVKDYEERIKDVGTVKIDDPKQIEAVKLMLNTFKNFTYIATMLSGGNHLIQTAGTERIGFSLLHMGHLTPQKVATLAEKMADVPMDQWEQRLISEYKNPSLVCHD